MSLHGLKHSHKRIAAFGSHSHEDMWRLYNEHGVVDFFNGKISEVDFLHTFIKKHRLSVSLEEYMRVIREEFAPIEGTREIVEELRAKGFNLGLLSDHGREWAEFCETKFDHHRLYHAVTYSFEVGACKPNAAMFARALAQLLAEPEETLFIDDNPRNIAGAEAFGIRGIVFTDAPALRRDLSAMGITL